MICFAYIDDILVYSRTPEEHEQHLQTLFRQLQAYGILLNPGKYVYSRERNANPTNIVELKALIGLLFLAGLLRSYHVNTANLWAMDGTGTEIFPCALSKERFKFLLRYLRFDKSDREERKKINRLALIREIF